MECRSRRCLAVKKVCCRLEVSERRACKALTQARSTQRYRIGQPVASNVFTLTSDNGKVFAKHQEIAFALQADFYFSHPYSAWQRGFKENTNGLVRQYFPKKHDIATITDKDVLMVMNKFNNRLRKCLGFKTPNEVFFGIKPTVVLVT